MAKVSKDHIDKFFDYGMDLDSRTIYMGSSDSGEEEPDDEDGAGTNWQMAEKVIKGLHLLEVAAPSGDKPITIIMNNLGGSEHHGMAMYDAIRSCRNKVIIKVYGAAMSMGSLILQAADVRQLAPHSRYMIHYGTWGTYDHPKIAYKYAEEGKRWDQIFEKIYLDRMMVKDQAEHQVGNDDHMETTLAAIVNRHNAAMSLTPKKKVKYRFANHDLNKRREDIHEVLQSLLDFDTYLSPEETVALGLADEVIPVYD